MSAAWTQQAREDAYRTIAEAITAAGPEREALFLARLCLLLAEALADPDAVARALQDAALPR